MTTPVASPPAFSAFSQVPSLAEADAVGALPIVFVPGIMGTRLQEPRLPYTGVWDPFGRPIGIDFLRLVEVDRPLRPAPGLDPAVTPRLSAPDLDTARIITNIGNLIFQFYGRMA